MDFQETLQDNNNLDNQPLDFKPKRKMSKKEKNKVEIENYKNNNKINNKEIQNIMEMMSPKLNFIQPNKLINDINIENLDQNSIVIDKDIIILGICGGSDSGKSYISTAIKKIFTDLGYSVTKIKEKNFFKSFDIKNENDHKNFIEQYDFDNPDAVDWELFESSLNFLKNNKPFNCPIYDFHQNKRLNITKKLKPANIILIEGRLFLLKKEIRDICNIKIYLDTDQDIMLSRRIFKNLERKKDIEEIIKRYNKYVKPSFENFIEPVKIYADFVIHNFGGSNFNFDNLSDDKNTIKILKDLILFNIK